MRITIDGKRYELNGMRDLGYSTHEHGGVRTVSVHYGPRSKRFIINTYSIWDRGDGTCRGDIWSVLEPADSGYAGWVEHLERAGIVIDDAPLPVVAEA